MTRTIAIAAVALLWAGQAHAQAVQGARMPCHDAASVAKLLGDKYSEAPVAFGLQSNGNLLQVYASKEKDTWTIVSTTPSGVSCIIGAGKMWNTIPAVSGDPIA